MLFVGEDELVVGGVNLNNVLLGLLPSCALSGLSGLY